MTETQGLSDIIDEAQTVRSLQRLLKGGELTALPKRKADRDILLALAAARFEKDRAYTESEVNIALGTWMSSFCSSAHIDHVTVRRYLVDNRLLRRDAAGRLYKVNGDRIDNTIGQAARRIHPGDVLEQLALVRERRKQARHTG